MEEKQILEMHAIVRGTVHGVGFRMTTYHLAMNLGLKGTVRNVPDGTVEIYAQGNKATLEQLIQKLHDTFADYIDSVQRDFKTPIRKYQSFNIIH